MMSMRRTAVKFALLLGGALTAYGVLYRVAGLDRLPGLAWIFYLMVPVAVFFALRAFKTDRGELPGFGRGVGLGALVSAGGSFIYAVYVYLYNRFIDDSLLVTIRETSLQHYTEQGLGGEKLERAMATVEAFSQPGPFSVQVFLMLTLTGILGGLLLAAIMRRNAAAAAAGGHQPGGIKLSPGE